MTEVDHRAEPRSTRWLPTTVVSLFALLLVVEIVIIALYGNYRNIIEKDGIEVVFVPARAESRRSEVDRLTVSPGVPATTADGRVAVELGDEGLVVRAPGELVIRFRAPDAGSTMVMGYDFGRRQRGARFDLALGRVASRHGVDTVWRRSIKGGRRSKGTIKHYLADHQKAPGQTHRIVHNKTGVSSPLEGTADNHITGIHKAPDRHNNQKQPPQRQQFRQLHGSGSPAGKKTVVKTGKGNKGRPDQQHIAEPDFQGRPSGPLGMLRLTAALVLANQD